MWRIGAVTVTRYPTSLSWTPGILIQIGILVTETRLLKGALILWANEYLESEPPQRLENVFNQMGESIVKLFLA